MTVSDAHGVVTQPQHIFGSRITNGAGIQMPTLSTTRARDLGSQLLQDSGFSVVDSEAGPCSKWHCHRDSGPTSNTGGSWPLLRAGCVGNGRARGREQEECGCHADSCRWRRLLQSLFSQWTMSQRHHREGRREAGGGRERRRSGPRGESGGRGSTGACGVGRGAGPAGTRALPPGAGTGPWS